jgi:hypothetical protein
LPVGPLTSGPVGPPASVVYPAKRVNRLTGIPLQRNNKMSIIKRITETEYVRSAITDKADLSAFKEKPSVRVILGVSTIGFSYIIGWPAIGALAALAIYLNKPWLVAIGGPLLYGFSHLVFLLGMYLAGFNYTKIFLRWATRVAVERLMRKTP